MNRVLVLGATGGMGYSIVNELSKKDIEVVAFSRSVEKLHHMFQTYPNVTIYPGDVFDRAALEKAANDIDVIFHAVNIPYGEWKEKLLDLTNNVIHVAKKQMAKLIIVDNIYSYGENPGTEVTETMPKKPNTKKGRLRLLMGETIQNSSVPFIITHLPDFYGPSVENGLINYTIGQILADKKAGFLGDQTVAREYIYTPDGAKAIVKLAMHDGAYGESWNIPGYQLITGQEILSVVRDITGYQKKVSTITRNQLRLAGLFNKQMRELVEMQYLNEDPVILNGGKYEKRIGELPKTHYKIALKETIKAYGFPID